MMYLPHFIFMRYGKPQVISLNHRQTNPHTSIGAIIVQIRFLPTQYPGTIPLTQQIPTVGTTSLKPHIFNTIVLPYAYQYFNIIFYIATLLR
jgi:hypothetical protein